MDFGTQNAPQMTNVHKLHSNYSQITVPEHIKKLEESNCWESGLDHVIQPLDSHINGTSRGQSTDCNPKTLEMARVLQVWSPRICPVLLWTNIMDNDLQDDALAPAQHTGSERQWRPSLPKNILHLSSFLLFFLPVISINVDGSKIKNEKHVLFGTWFS